MNLYVNNICIKISKQVQDLPAFAILRYIRWQFITEVLVQPLGNNFEGQAPKFFFSLGDETR